MAHAIVRSKSKKGGGGKKRKFPIYCSSWGRDSELRASRIDLEKYQTEKETARGDWKKNRGEVPDNERA